MTCLKYCGVCEEDTDGGIWCGVCSNAYNLEEARATLMSIKTQGFTGGASTSPAMEEFAATGDPSVFAKKGALDYKPQSSPS